jgi:hypothetical protein
MIFAIISAFLAYRKAKDTGRNGWLWALVAAVTFIGTQLVAALILGLGLGIILGIMGRTEEEFKMAEFAVTAFAVILSFVTTWLLLRYLDRVPQPNNFTTPPPPENFN